MELMFQPATAFYTSRRASSLHTCCSAALPPPPAVVTRDGGGPRGSALRRVAGKVAGKLGEAAWTVAAPALEVLNAAAWDVTDLIQEGVAASNRKAPYEPPEVGRRTRSRAHHGFPCT